MEPNTIEYIMRISEIPSSQRVFATMWKSCKLNYENGTIVQMSFKHNKSNGYNAKRISTNKYINAEDGKYSFLIEFHETKANPFVLFMGKFENALELCIKHFQLRSNAPNSYVIVAGECEIKGDLLRYNLFSGTYSLPIMANFSQLVKINKTRVESAMKNICNVILSDYLGKSIAYTSNVIFNNTPIKISNIPKGNLSKITLSKKYINNVRAQAPRGKKKEAETLERQKLRNLFT